MISYPPFLQRLIDALRSNSDSTAVVDGNGSRHTTYAQLLQLSLRVASSIHQRHLAPHSFIAIYLPPDRDYLAAQIGIWLAGHTIVPLSIHFPSDRVSYIMSHCHSPLLINQSFMDELTEASDFVAQSSSDIAALYYTSGSTGRPKGVQLPFDCYDIPPFFTDTLQSATPLMMGATAPMHFIVAKYVFAPLLIGGVVNFIPEPFIKDVAEFQHYLSVHRISCLFTTPSVLRNLTQPSSSLKVVFAAGERLSRISSHHYTLINIYGQTETGGACFAYQVDQSYDNTPIGKQILPLEYKIVDGNNGVVRQGEDGELCLKGKFTTGYYDEPELTAMLLSDGWLHTGDVVRQLPDGNLLFVNRMDWMMKINGQRVEPEEVEKTLLRMEGMKDAVVKGFASDNRQFLCAYYIAQPSLQESDIRRHLEGVLPSYMIPSYFVKMDSFPLNDSGKIDRQSLPHPLSDKQHSHQDAQTAVEATLCKAFAAVLGLRSVGLDDNFFDLGGDSIAVMSLQTLCPDLPLSARMIYTNGTPRLIAKACEENVSYSFSVLPDYPLSQSQLGIYVECIARQGQIAYNNGVLLRLGKNVDLPRLASAFEKVIAAHPSVKTRLFLSEDGTPRQRRNDDEPFYLSVETMDEQQFESLKSTLMQPFDLLHDRLFRVRIFDTPEASYLFMDFHHVIFDGTSLSILFSDLEKAYQGEALEQESFSGFEVAQEEETLRQTKVYADAKDWSLRMFGDLEITSLPLPDKSEPVVAFGRQELDLGLTENELKEACQRFGVTPNVLTTTVFGYLLGNYNYSQVSLFATIYHGRDNLKLNHTIGMLVKTLPVYMKWNGQTTLRTLLQTTKGLLQDAVANDIFSFAELKTANNYVSSQVIFAYQGDISVSESIGGECYSQLPLMENATGEPLAFEVSRREDRFIARAEYHSNDYSDSFIDRLIHTYVHLIKTFVAVMDGDTLLKDIPLLAPDDRKTLLALGSGKPLNGKATDTFVTMFRRQVQLTPNAIAVVDDNSSLTYSELDKQSDALAALLMKEGVVNESVVALLLPRKKEFLLAVLAVFKSGGAYVSLDLDYPQSRVDFMLNDLDAHFLMTTSQLAAERGMTAQHGNRNIILLDQFDFSTLVPSVDFSTPQSLAYIIYTSGTSGNPKGVMVEHHSLCAMLEWLIPMENLKTGDKCALHTNFSFDASVPDLFGPLVCGAQIHIVSSALRYDLGAFSRFLLDHHITGLTMSTRIGMELLENYDLSLRYLFLGGEDLHVNRKTSVKVINGYGPTEFTVCSSYHVVDSNRVYDRIPIGRPVPGSISLVIGPEGDLLPWGAMGELCLVGSQLARGYWRREEQTREKFVDCPFLPGERMYRTGDLVQWNQDGELQFHGRIDNQVKLHGYRIELGEIEKCINDFPSVQMSAVVLVKHNNLQFLSAFFVADEAIDAEKLRVRLSDNLPAYMVPLKLVQLERMPMTPNGKIDRRQLVERGRDLTVMMGTCEAPANPTEQMLLDLAKQLLGTEEVGVTDDLTLLGLSSLDAIRLVSLAEKKGVRLKVNDILHKKSIRNFARQDASYGRWLNEYRLDKPIVVAIQGFSPHPVQQYFDALCEKYSVFDFASLDDYYDEVFSHQSKSEVMARYVEMLHEVLPADARIYAFTGHCYGGEFAYRCAALWQSHTGQSPKVLVLNTPLRTDDEVRQMMPPQTIIDQMPPERQEKVYAWRQQHDRVKSILDGVPMPPFQGEVVFFKALQPYLAVNKLTLDSEAFIRQEEVYMQRWHLIQPQMKIIPVQADHFSMLEEPYINLYVKEL